jgi:hypothetical protein
MNIEAVRNARASEPGVACHQRSVFFSFIRSRPRPVSLAYVSQAPQRTIVLGSMFVLT